MCTAITFRNQNHEQIFGRTMDFHFILDPHLVVFPAETPWENVIGQTYADRFAVAGIARHAKNLFVMFDGINEEGLAGGMLYFNGFGSFPQSLPQDRKAQVPALDFLHYALGACASLDELRSLLAHTSLVGVRDNITDSVAPIHWMFVDTTGECLVVEQTATGLHIHVNPVGVMTNSPDFLWHMTNLRNYLEVTPEQAEQADWDSFKMTSFGQANGTSALPGGYTSPARFVRTVYQKLHMAKPQSMQDSIVSGFHMLEGVTLPDGVVKASSGTFDYTQYTVMIDMKNKVYYFKTYENPQITRVNITPFWASSDRSVHDIGNIQVPITYGTI